MKRYLLFYGPQYYPLGGWKDFAGSFDSIEEALRRVVWEVAAVDWCQVVDTSTQSLAYEGELDWNRNLVEVSLDVRIDSKGDRT